MFYRPKFENRTHSGELLAEEIKSWINSNNISSGEMVIVSLLRGGYPVGKVIEDKLELKHIPITAAKIGVPGQDEVALGALCFDSIYINKDVETKLRNYLGKNYERLVSIQIDKAKEKLSRYSEKYNLIKENVCKELKNKYVLIIDDGVATGASAKAVANFAKDCNSKKNILAVPVAPADFKCGKFFDECIILIKDPAFMAVGQYYEDFSEVNI